MDETSLVEAARADPDAFARLYRRTLPQVYRFALSLTRDHAAAEDVTSETYRRAIGAMAAYQHRDRPFVAWLFTIARNIVRDGARRGGRETDLHDHDAPIHDWPGESLAREEEHETLRQAVAMLPPAQRRAIVLRYGHGWPYREVARRIGKSEAAAKQLSHRGILRLREILCEEDHVR